MKPERVASMKTNAVAFDLETHLIQPGLLAPPLVCGSIALPDMGDGKMGGRLLAKDGARSMFKAMTGDDRYVICGANIAYDMLVIAVDFGKLGEDVMPAIFAAYDPTRSIIRGDCNGRVFDVLLAESLHGIAQGHQFKDWRTGGELSSEAGRRGRYSLNAVVDQVLGRDDAKANDRWRLRYAELEDIPIPEWPFEAAQYPVDDAANTLETALAQAGHEPSCWPHSWNDVTPTGDLRCDNVYCACTIANAPRDCKRRQPRRNLHDLARQAYAAWALHLGAARGFYVNQQMVDKLEEKSAAKHAAMLPAFLKAEIIREDGTEDQGKLKRLVAWAYGTRQNCTTCEGKQKVPSPKTNGKTKITCSACSGTGFDLVPQVPRTPKGGVSTSRDTLLESGDPLLESYSEFAERKIETTYIPLMRKGRVCTGCGAHGTKKSPHAEGCAGPGWRGVPLNLRVNAIVATGRISIEDGLHGLPRKGGVRECFEARPGHVYSSVDYEAGELRTLAQVCLWTVKHSRLAEALNRGLDAHLALAGTMTGRGYEELLKLRAAKDKRTANDRQAAKAANFGFPGGMAELTFTLRKRADPDVFTPCPAGPHELDGVVGYNGLRTCILMDGHESCGVVTINSYKDKPCAPVCKACVESAARLREYWFQQWPEMRDYFRWVQTELDLHNEEVEQFMSKRIRGAVGFCDGANGNFQGLLADAAKNAFCQITRECYDRTCRVENSEHMDSRYAGSASPLFGSRPIMLAHDETLTEHPEDVASDAAIRVSEIMVEALRFACPDLAPACKAEPALMRRLYKSAEPTYNIDGQLIPWEPRK